LAGAALGLAAKALGCGPAPEAVQAALSSAPPEVLVKLKEAETEFLRVQVAALELDNADRASARNREAATGDHITPRLLAAMVTVGYFVVMLVMIFLPDSIDGGTSILAGGLSAGFGMVLSYYFGSSAGSKLKTEALARK